MVEPVPLRTCNNCLNWQPTREPYGQCRASLPMPLMTPDRLMGEAIWPLTMTSDWCAHWQRKET